MNHLQHTALTAALLLALAACGQPAQPAAEQAAPPAATAPAAAPVMEAVTEAAPEAAAPAAENDGPITAFSANGFSPAWMAEVNGDLLVFEVPDFATPDASTRTITVERSASAKGVNFDGLDGEVGVTLDINGKECTKTGEKREFTATLTYGGQSYHGCADALR
ncbi:MAG: hypothetical protein Q4G42_05605 [Neisseria sp.]|nr:hypothetical protein [Neisseria sp.]